jgi:hypothetical protein
MLLPDKWKNPRVATSIGMFLLALALIAQRFVPLTAVIEEDWADGVHGLLFGLSIGVMLWSVRLLAQQKRSGGN